MSRTRAPGVPAGHVSGVLGSNAASRVRPTLRALAPVLVGALLVTWLLLDARDHARSHTEARLRADVAIAVTQVSAEARDQLAKASLAAGSTGTTVPAISVASSQVSLSSVIAARDSGAPSLDDTTSPASIVVPVYGSAAPPRTTAERRQSITAYRLVPLALQPVLASAGPGNGGLVVRGPSHPVAAEPRSAPPGARTFTVPLDLGGASGWVLQGWLPTDGTPATTWVLVVGLIALFAAFSAILAADQRHALRSQARQDQLERDGVLVSGLAPVVQASLDLGEVIPAASSHLTQGLGLVGLTLSAPGAAGERQLFAWGRSPDPSVLPVVTPPAQLDAGGTYAMSLARGGRVLGVLRVVAGAPLASTDLRALATASELLGSTLANAEAFAQQQSVVERMQSVDELKTVFLATASHELRTPVAAIVGFSTLVLEQWGHGDPEQTRAYLERVLGNARSLETLTEQLLDFSRLERGIKPAAGDLLDLGQTTTRVLTEQPELTSAHRLALDIAPDCLVRGSEPAVARIVTNLVGNAAKYSPPDTAITVTVHSDGEQVALTVDDEGPGVPLADRERIFTRFYRGRGDEVASTRGTGVGLAIVAEFAASMSGTAAVQQAPSGGARFRVTFPAAGVVSHALNEGEPHVRLA